MKKSLLLGAALAMAAGAMAQIAPGEYYIKNVETGMFLNEGWTWGTHAVTKAYPCAFEITPDGDGYILKSAYGCIYFNDNQPWMDNQSPVKANLESIGDAYAIKVDGKYLYANEEKNYITPDPDENLKEEVIKDLKWLASLNMCETILYTVDGDDKLNGDKSAWEIISREDMIKALDAATPENPVEASFFLNAGQIEVNANNNISSWTYAKHYTKALKPEEPVEDVEIPEPVYANDFEDGVKDATVVGSGEIKNVGGLYGNVFSNAMDGMRQNYLLLPENALSHSVETNALTVAVWVNRGNETDVWHYMWSPLFTAYAEKANDNSWPMLACQYRGVLQVNCAGWSDYTDAQNVKNVNGVYHGDSDWLADGEWHLYTATFTPTTAKVYFDGNLVNEWVIDGVDNTAAGLFSNGADLKYICLGGNQAWNWGDPDPGFWFDDLALYNVELTKDQIKALMDQKTNATKTRAEGEEIEEISTAEIVLPFGGWFGHNEWYNKTTYAWCQNDAEVVNEGGKEYILTPVAGTDVVSQDVEGMPAGNYKAEYRVVNQNNTPLVIKFNDAEGKPFEYEGTDLWYDSAQNSMAHNVETAEFTVGEDGKLSLKMEKTINPEEQNRFAFKSFALYYLGKDGAAVEAIAIDENAPVEYYNMQGIRVANPTNGLYIKRQGKTSTKVMVK